MEISETKKNRSRFNEFFILSNLILPLSHSAFGWIIFLNSIYVYPISTNELKTLTLITPFNLNFMIERIVIETKHKVQVYKPNHEFTGYV